MYLLPFFSCTDQFCLEANTSSTSSRKSQSPYLLYLLAHAASNTLLLTSTTRSSTGLAQPDPLLLFSYASRPQLQLTQLLPSQPRPQQAEDSPPASPRSALIRPGGLRLCPVARARRSCGSARVHSSSCLHPARSPLRRACSPGAPRLPPVPPRLDLATAADLPPAISRNHRGL